MESLEIQGRISREHSPQCGCDYCVTVRGNNPDYRDGYRNGFYDARLGVNLTVARLAPWPLYRAGYAAGQAAAGVSADLTADPRIAAVLQPPKR